MIEAVRIRLSVLWGCLMLTYLLGDVLRVFSGDFQPGEVGGMEASPVLYLGLAALLTIPIVMAFLSLTLPYRANRWATIVLAAFLFVFNAIGLPTYPSAYDQFLIVVGLLFNVVTAWTAWRWECPQGVPSGGRS